MVDLHNYSSASGTKNKLHNWEVLNRYGIERTPGIQSLRNLLHQMYCSTDFVVVFSFTVFSPLIQTFCL